jgi:hypothetical protein
MDHHSIINIFIIIIIISIMIKHQHDYEHIIIIMIITFEGLVQASRGESSEGSHQHEQQKSPDPR